MLHMGYKVIGYTFAKQSCWYKSRGLHVYKAILLVQTARAFLLGAGNPTISWETETQVLAACQPQPRQPRIIKLISQLQKPTRKISDTWITDTGKRETRYWLVKIHQTILQPHNSTGAKASIQVEDGNFMLNTSTRTQARWNQKTDNWDSWNSTLLLQHQPVRGGSYTLPPSPQVLSMKTPPWSLSGTLGLLSLRHPFPLLGPCN